MHTLHEPVMRWGDTTDLALQAVQTLSKQQGICNIYKPGDHRPSLPYGVIPFTLLLLPPLLLQILAAPAIIGVLIAPTAQVSYGLLFVAYITAETWLGPAAAIVQVRCC